MSTKLTKEIIDRIFKAPGVKYELSEFESLGKPIEEILSISAKTVETGRDTGKTKYFLSRRMMSLLRPKSTWRSTASIFAASRRCWTNYR